MTIRTILTTEQAAVLLDAIRLTQKHVTVKSATPWANYADEYGMTEEKWTGLLDEAQSRVAHLHLESLRYGS